MDEPVGILVVDDRSENLLAFEAVLEPLGEDLVLAHSGDEALRHLLKRDFAVILLDVRMPDLDGHQTANLIRQRGRSANTPILFITGNNREEVKVASGYAAGAVDYIIKPYEPEVLRSKVRVFTKLFRQARQVEKQAQELTETCAHQRKLLEENRLLSQQLAERVAEAEQQADLLRELANDLIQVEQRERRRLAQLLHDHLQQLLVAAHMKIDTLDASMEAGRIIEKAKEVREFIIQAIKESRSLTVELSPPILFEGGFIPALNWFAKHVQEQHGLKVEADLDVSVPLSDEMRILLFQIARELVFNAVKHAGVEKIRVWANAKDGCLCMGVEDEGRGFDPTALGTRNSPEAFGLFSIRERLKVFGGTLGIDSRPGAGAKLRVEVPFANGVDAKPDVHRNHHGAAFVTGPVVQPRPTSDRIRVLIADDHRILREGLKWLLSDQPDIEVVGEAFDGHMAVEVARELHPDVIVMDVSMPGMNGIEATRLISQESPHICIIGLSTHSDESISSMMMSAGAATYLLKDGPSDALIAAIRACRPALASAGPEPVKSTA